MADVEANAGAAQQGKKKSSCCAKCCKCYCVCCCCCLLLLVIAVIVVFNTVLKVEAKNPPAPAAPTSSVELGVSYAGADPNSDETFKSNLVSGVLGALGGNFTDADGSLASSLEFSSSSRRLEDAGAADRQLATAWTVTLTLSGEAAMSAAEVFNGPAFSPSSIPGVVSVSVSSEMSVLAMGHLLKDLNFVCTAAISKVLDEYSGEITKSMETKNVTGVQLGISEEGWVWVAFRKAAWKYSATAMACEATESWEAALKSATEQDLGECQLSNVGVKALVGSGKGGDECYMEDYRSLLTETQLAQCPAAFSCGNNEEACQDFEYPGCSLCEAPAKVTYLPCAPF